MPRIHMSRRHHSRVIRINQSDISRLRELLRALLESAVVMWNRVWGRNGGSYLIGPGLSWDRHGDDIHITATAACESPK